MVASNVTVSHQRQPSTMTTTSSAGGNNENDPTAAAVAMHNATGAEPPWHGSADSALLLNNKGTGATQAGRHHAAVIAVAQERGKGERDNPAGNSTLLQTLSSNSSSPAAAAAKWSDARLCARCAARRGQAAGAAAAAPPPLHNVQSVGCDTQMTDQDDERSRSFSRYQGAPVCQPLPIYKRELPKLLVSFLFLSISAFLNFFLLVVVHDVVPRYDAMPGVNSENLTFMLIAQQPWAWVAGDVLSFMASAAAVTLIVFHRARWIVLRRAFTMFAIMFGLRSLCLGTTFMPPSFHNRDEICYPQKNWTQVDIFDISRRFISYMVTMGLTSGQSKILCGDLMFSGHTSVFTLTYCIVTHYSPPRAHLLRWIITPVCYIGMVLTVISGGHYTIDVLIAYWLATHVFYAYHHVFEARNACMRAYGGLRPPLAKLWWYYACFWFESSVPHDGQLPNSIEWPFPWPPACIRLVAHCDIWLRAPHPNCSAAAENDCAAAGCQMGRSVFDEAGFCRCSCCGEYLKSGGGVCENTAVLHTDSYEMVHGRLARVV